MNESSTFDYIDESGSAQELGLLGRDILSVFGIAVAIFILGIPFYGWHAMIHPLAHAEFPLPQFAAACGALFGIGMFLIRAYAGLQHRKFGGSTLEACRPRLGETFAGHIRTEKDVAASGSFMIRLRCEQTREVRGADGKYRNITTVLWEASVTAPAATRSTRGIPFSFAIPASGLPRGVYSGIGVISWPLHVHAPTSGVSYSTDYQVSVAAVDHASGKPPHAKDAGPDSKFEPPQVPFQGEFVPVSVREKRQARFVLGFALLFAAGGMLSLVQEVRYTLVGERVQGVLVSPARTDAVVRLSDGTTALVRKLTGSGWTENQRLELTCRKNVPSPRTCRVDTGFERWKSPFVLALGGLVLLVLGWRYFVRVNSQLRW